MSVYKDPRSPYWRYDFQIGGRRFHGWTKARTERDAEAVERSVRERAMKNMDATQQNGPKRKRRMSPKLYLIRANGSTRFKIGTTTDPAARLSALRTGSALPLEIVTTTDITPMEIERAIHRALAPWRSHGEWFDFGAMTDAFLTKVRSDGLLGALQVLKPRIPESGSSHAMESELSR